MGIRDEIDGGQRRLAGGCRVNGACLLGGRACAATRAGCCRCVDSAPFADLFDLKESSEIIYLGDFLVEY